MTIIFIMILIISLYLYNQYKFKQMMNKYYSKGSFVTVGNLRLHYISKGSGTPIVFLHGGILNGNDFEKVIELAAERGYRGISFDRPGYGYSDRNKNKKMTPMEQAEVIHEALIKLGVEKPIIVGHSWSGNMVLTYALMYPNEISGIVTLSAVMYKEGYPAENGDAISTLVNTPIVGDVITNTLLFPFGKFMVKSMLKAMFSPDQVPAEYRKNTFAYWLRPSQFKANREDVLAFVPAAEKICSRYKEIEIPVIIVVGELDPFGVIEQAKRLHQDISKSKLLILPNIGHMIPQGHPYEVMKAIGEIFH